MKESTKIWLLQCYYGDEEIEYLNDRGKIELTNIIGEINEFKDKTNLETKRVITAQRD